MLKYVLLASAMLATTPALAQDNPAAPPSQTNPAAPQSQPVPAQTPAADDQMATAPAQSDAAAQPAASKDQIAQVVESEFPTYDKDGDGTLNSREFGAWMVALRTQSDSSAKTDGAEMKKWTATAFAQADTDKSKSVSKPELTTFLASNKG